METFDTRIVMLQQNIQWPENLLKARLSTVFMYGNIVANMGGFNL